MHLDGKNILTFGTTGAQGAGLVPAVAAVGGTAVRATTNPDRARRWRSEGVATVVANLLEPDTVRTAVDDLVRGGDPVSGVEAAALHVPLGLGGPATVEAVIASIGALREAGLPVSVNLGSPVPPPGVPDPFGARAMAAAVLETGAVALSPTAYLENHAAPWALDPISRGELPYPRPSGDTVAWIAAADLGTAAVAALSSDIAGELLVLAGPQRLTFDDLARELALGLGRDLAFQRVSPAQYADLLRPFMGGAADAVGSVYASMPEGPNPLMTPRAEPTWERLGVTPTSARTWASTVLAAALRATVTHTAVT
ncbi:SDR family oxidoreductase [Nakamurella sp. GG22]